MSNEEVSEYMFQAGQRVAELHKVNTEAMTHLREAVLQIEYLHGKFKETGSGNTVLTRINIFLSQHDPS